MNEIFPAILAAGKGSRLGLNHLPKPMVSVDGRPLMQFAVESLFKVAFGTNEIKAVIGYRGEVIQNYFGTDLEYVFQDKLTGNAGALDAILSHNYDIHAKHILTIQGDDACQATPENLQNLIRLHHTRQADISILTVNNPDSNSHQIEYLSNRDGRVLDIIPRISTDSNGRYTAGIFIISGCFLEKFLPILKGSTPDGKELGISKLLVLALQSHQRIFQLCSPHKYISVNNQEGLQILRQRGTELAG